jgi:type I restriction enzyme R subunit
VYELPLAVNVVRQEKDLVEAIQQPSWWASPTDEKLCEAIERLAPLMKYRQRRDGAMVHLDLQDLTVVKEWVEFGPGHERMTSSAYRERVEKYIRDLVNENPVLRKIRDGEPVSNSEVHELADLLERHDPHVTEELLRKVYDHKTARFLQFIRHILGLEKLESWTATVTRAFDEFIAGHTTFSADQIQFIRVLETFVLQTGKVEKKDLIEAPFTQIHPKGVRGIFKPDEIEEILEFTNGFVA